MQNGLPVCYASRALNKAEQRYAQIEKELYACVFACERFHAYIYGRTDITIETDHKPLVSIIKKSIVDSPTRLQRMLLRLQRYTFKLVYKPGKHLYIADALSRAYEPTVLSALHPSSDSLHDEVCAVQRQAVSRVTDDITDVQFVQLQKYTETDNELIKLKKYVLKGWPSVKGEVDDIIKPYWNYKEDLSFAHGLVWKNERIIVPKILRKEFLNKLHIDHMGLEKCKLRAREILFWPGLNNDLKNMVLNCQICLSFRRNNQKE
ncbi:unnamed protein product [Parnassius apollo]|uniref:RNA-directed DNA polymerase n=1 Tax=Parnassius apollo TaxID=110799 RepID=A0A8S3X3N1_PARAO|nr:unnamed protein product [Parnassius apollo]